MRKAKLEAEITESSLSLGKLSNGIVINRQKKSKAGKLGLLARVCAFWRQGDRNKSCAWAFSV